MAILTKSQILKNKTKVKNKKIYIEEWGGDVYIKKLSYRDRLEWESARFSKYEEIKSDGDITELQAAELITIISVIYSVYGKNNKPIFDISDYNDILEESSRAIELCFEEANKLNQFIETNTVDSKKN